MTRKNRAVIKALFCENLSVIETAMVFKCSVDEINQVIYDAMQETGYKHNELWLAIHRPNLSLFNYRRTGKKSSVESTS